MRHIRTVVTLLTVAASLALVASPVLSQIHRTPDPVRRADLHRLAEVDRMVMVPMRDGVRLATEIYRPRDAQGPVPAIFWRTPYNFSPLPGPNLERPSALLKFGLDAVERGYAFVVQNERGKFFSEGDWEILGRPRTDGYDALTWITDQPWSNGKVATLGCSSTAEWQMGLAAMRHPGHAAAVPMGQGAGIGRMGPFYEQGNFYRGGALQLPMAVWLFGEQNTQRPTFPPETSREDLERLATYFDLAAQMPQVDWKQALWHLPIQTIMESVGGPKGIFGEFAARTPDDPGWYEGGLYHDDEPFGVPALWANSWYDLSVSPNLALYGHVRANADEEVREHQYMVIAPSLHCNMYRLTNPLIVGERNFGDTDFGFDEMLWSFLDRFTKPEANGFEDRYARVRYFLMGEDGWQNADNWPPAGVEPMTLYLDSDGNANSAAGDGRLTADAGDGGDDADRFVYDPGSPVPTHGGAFCCMGEHEPGSFDQRGIEARADVLVYATEPFPEPLTVVGSIDVILHVSSDAADTDFTVKLVDVHPDGRAFNLDDTILRMRYREGFDRDVRMEAGEVYEVRLGPLATANVFGAGHRLRIEVSSSNFPRYDRNLNTGGNNYDESEWRVARNAVHHSAEYPSRIVLPVLGQ
ncbi:MAG: CocE/NonD family hydrolase [Acidobacteriota bacterium]|nr:CocE/NonD family hydrolase [Acidobacteriota bacterium]MDE3264583.1 CocE/NonD family hydrolase [Acidobacteriota bacterium]